jgi:hypothetical protein
MNRKSDDVFDESDFDLLASGISEFASHDSSEVTLPPSTRRLQWAVGDVVGEYRITQFHATRVDVVCVTCGESNNVSRGKLKIRGCPKCSKQRAAAKLTVPLRKGERYGFLEVVQDSGYETSASGKRRHRVRCMCLNCDKAGVRDYDANHIRAGKIISCGCWRNSVASRRGFQCEIGKKYGKWTIIRLHEEPIAGETKRRRYWCKCECGVEKAVLAFQLKNATPSSGCQACGRSSSAQKRRGTKRRSGGPGSRVPLDVQKDARKRWKRENERELRKDATYRAITGLRKRCAKVVKGGSQNKLTFGTTRKKFLEYIEKQFKDGMCWENYGELWHIDHIYPLSRINKSDKEQIEAVMNWRNLRPMLGKENLLKLDSTTKRTETLFAYILEAVSFERQHKKAYEKSLREWLSENPARLE